MNFKSSTNGYSIFFSVTRDDKEEEEEGRGWG